MLRSTSLLLLLLAAGCMPNGRDVPADAEVAEPKAPSISDLAGLDTLTLDADATALADRPRSPLRIDGACPFEGCTYGDWTTSDSTTVYVASGDTTSAAFVLPARTTFTADGGFVLITRVGRAVARRAVEVYVGDQGERPVAAGDTLTVLDYQGEGYFGVWFDGNLGSSDQVVPFSDTDDGPFDLLDEPRAQWWAHITLADGRAGWLWMDRTPRMIGADSLE